jgi:TIGR03009 family protein
LDYWTQHSKKVKTFRCEFTRRDFNPTFVKSPDKPWKISTGVIKYARPDKGMFQVEKVWRYTMPKAADGAVNPLAKPDYLIQPNPGEHWISDGKSIFEFNYKEKLLIQRELPKHLQGKAIVNGPLPFLFGVERAQLQKRYWMRIITPKAAKGQYWIEAWPKNQQDAAYFQRISVILDEKMFRPEYMELYYPGGEERTLYQFTNRKENDITEDLKKLFNQSFYAPKTPFKWKKVVHRADQPDRRVPPPRIGRKR